MRWAMLVAGTWLVLSSCSNEAPVAEDDRALTTADPAGRGRALFVTHCALCHGERADGRGVRRSGLVGTPTDFTSPAWRRGRSPAEIFDIVANGSEGTSMPAWLALDVQALWDVTAYVLSVAEDPSPGS